MRKPEARKTTQTKEFEIVRQQWRSVGACFGIPEHFFTVHVTRENICSTMFGAKKGKLRKSKTGIKGDKIPNMSEIVRLCIQNLRMQFMSASGSSNFSIWLVKTEQFSPDIIWQKIRTADILRFFIKKYFLLAHGALTRDRFWIWLLLRSFL